MTALTLPTHRKLDLKGMQLPLTLTVADAGSHDYYRLNEAVQTCLPLPSPQQAGQSELTPDRQRGDSHAIPAQCRDGQALQTA
jgi:hypothetical protein